MHSFVRHPSLQLVESTVDTTCRKSFLPSIHVFIHFSTHVSIHLGQGFALPILLADKVAKPSNINIFQLIPQ